MPVFVQPEKIGILVAGDPGRNQSKGYVNNHIQGGRVSRKVECEQESACQSTGQQRAAGNRV